LTQEKLHEIKFTKSINTQRLYFSGCEPQSWHPTTGSIPGSCLSWHSRLVSENNMSYLSKILLRISMSVRNVWDDGWISYREINCINCIADCSASVAGM